MATSPDTRDGPVKKTKARCLFLKMAAAAHIPDTVTITNQAEVCVARTCPLISLAGLTLPAVSPLLLAQVAADVGFDAVGVNLLRVWYTASAQAGPFTQEVARLGDALTASGLTLIHGGHLLLGALDRPSAKSVLAAMRELRAQYVVLIAAPHAPRAIIDEDFAFVAAEAADLPMLVEFAPYTGWRTLADAMQFIDAHQSVPLRLLVDVLHLMRSESLSLWTRERDWPVGLVQVCDAPIALPTQESLQLEARGQRLDVGEGSLPLQEIFARVPRHVPIEVEAPCLALRNLTPHARARRSLACLLPFLAEQGYRPRAAPDSPSDQSKESIR
ncbi:sugar phosphate isomerase/epimerase [Bordetella sp. 15P40C-2]|uniref:sugar phosphate isomerase/epimerase family protein n=1 Tax=Bordetella sp. 15P40C-2 TaxID=2572246 RepID=UPI0013298C78|nr:TIM barrel protein [Bordetella sp. 15P40C-2]MVW72367.1 hypothetical protein [Bordetella sp. 15P40C-2]